MKDNKIKSDDKMFFECISDMRETLDRMGNKYPIEIINGALIELGLRMAMIQGGSYHTIKVFAGVMHNIATFGQLIEKDLQELTRQGEEPNPFDDWKYTTTKRTLH